MAMRLSLLVMVTLSWMPLASGNIQEIDPPEILAPEDNAIIYGPQLTVRWAPLEEGQWCQIQIARDPDFNEILAAPGWQTLLLAYLCLAKDRGSC